MSKQLRPILVAEDEESDRMILELAFQKAKLPRPLVLVHDGQQLIDYIGGTGPYADRSAHPLPALVVLDVKMPGMNGLDVLAWLATQPQFKEIPAVALSSSADESDMEKARQLGAREYFVKPHSLHALIDIAHQMHTRWLNGDSTAE